MIDWDGMKLNELNWVRNYTVYTFTVRALKLHTHSSRSRRAVSSDVCIYNNTFLILRTQKIK